MSSVLRSRTKNSQLIRKICGISVLIAATIVLQVIGGSIPAVGGVQFNLALVPLVLAAILYGPAYGALTGFILGLIIIPFSSAFLSVNAWATVLLCMIKTSVAGAVAGFLFKILYKKYFKTAVFTAAIVTPIINTAIFSVGCVLFFGDLLSSLGQEAGQTPIQFLFLGMIGINFIVEFSLNLILSPTICFIVKTIMKEDKFGTTLSYFNKPKEETKVETVDDNKPTDVEEVVQQIENPEVKQVENRSETPDVLDNVSTEKVEVENTSENTETNNSEETK